MKRNKYQIYRILFFIIIVLALYVFDYLEENQVLNKVQYRQNEYSENLEIYYLDVGQADSTLIKYKNNNILIDAGNNEDGQLLVNYFKELYISEFSYVFATHPHEDHIGGMDDIINNFKIENFYMPDIITTTKTFEDIITALEENNLYYQVPKIDEEIKIDDLILKILYVGEDEKDLNNSSIIIKIEYGNTSYIFMGDSTTTTEKKILKKDLKADVLKVGHHGSEYSTSLNFLEKVAPKYAIISVGEDNSYKHPSKIILNRLNDYNVITYRTDINNTIHLTSNGNTLNFEFIKTNTNGG